MAINISTDEIFDIAEQIEKKGAVYYNEAAKRFSDPKLNKLLLGLADMENAHLVIFHAMRSQLKNEGEAGEVRGPEGRLGAYLKAMAEGRIFNFKADPVKLLEGTEKLKDIFYVAIGLEKDSIAFYLGLKEMVPKESGRDKIDQIIKEEMNHISILNEAWAGMET